MGFRSSNFEIYFCFVDSVRFPGSKRSGNIINEKSVNFCIETIPRLFFSTSEKKFKKIGPKKVREKNRNFVQNLNVEKIKFDFFNIQILDKNSIFFANFFWDRKIFDFFFELEKIFFPKLGKKVGV